MTPSEIYLELLRAGLWNRPAVVSGSVNIADIMAMAQRQVTTPIVCKALLDSFGDRFDSVMKGKLSVPVERCAKAHQAADTVIAYVTGLLEKEGIGSVLLKGQGIASWYPVPVLRQPGDIDLYVRDYDKASDILMAMFPDYEQETDKHRAFHIGGSLELELHRFTEVLASDRQNAIYQSISDEGTSRDLTPVTLGGEKVMTPSDTFNAFYIFHHLWGHTRGMGIGMRQLCDWSAFLRAHKGVLDTEKLSSWLQSLHLMDVWQVFGAAAVHALGLEPDEVPFYDSRCSARGKRLVDFILIQGDNREFKHGRHGQSALRHKAGSVGYVFWRFWKLFPIFPGLALKQVVGDFKNGFLKLFKAGASDLGAKE